MMWIASALRALRGGSLVAVACVALGCNGYGSKPVLVHLGTSPPLADGTGAVAYIVKLEDWNDIVASQGFNTATGQVLPAFYVPKDPAGFADKLERYRVREGPPPVDTRILAHHAIYVVRVGDRFSWDDIRPELQGPNAFSVEVMPNGKQGR